MSVILPMIPTNDNPKENDTLKELKNDFVTQLLAAMKEKGLNSNTLSEKMGVTRQWISRITTQLDTPTLPTMIKLLNALDKKLVIKVIDK